MSSLRDELQSLNAQYLSLLHQAVHTEDPMVVEMLFGVDSDSIECIRAVPQFQLTRAATRGGFTLAPRVGKEFWKELMENNLRRAIMRQAFAIINDGH